MVGHPVSIDPAWHYRITLDQYHRMIDVGILGEDDHVELLEGSLVSMSPQDKPHAFAVTKLTKLLARQLPANLELRTQLPLTLAPSEPEPDLAVVDEAVLRSAARHPEHALLVIEVANASLAKDRRSKTAIYAAAGVTEYWIVDVVARAVEVFQDPDRTSATYRTSARVEIDARIECGSIPGLTVDVVALFP